MQEIVDNLTEKKLETANRISDLEKSLSLANTQISKAHDELSVLKEQEIENESLKRQIKRLTDENEELISEMEQLESKSKEERSADVAKLDALKSDNEKLLEATKNNEKFLIKLSDHQEQFDKISLELQATKEENEKLAAELSSLNEQNAILTQHSRKQADKLKLYKTKTIEFSTKLKQLKISKEVLAKIVAEYSQSVTKWQLDIIAAMKQIECKSTGRCSDEMTSPIQPVSVKESQTVDDNTNEEKLSLLQTTNDKLTQQIDQLKQQLADDRNSMFEKAQNEETLRVDSADAKKTISDLQAQLERSAEDNQKLAAEIDEIRNAYEAKRQKLSDDFQSENAKLLHDVDHLRQTLGSNRAEASELNEKISTLTNELSECTVRAKQKEAEANELSGALEQLQQKRSQENDELLSEMREINEALKNRGDVISKQKQTIGELNDRIERLQQQTAELSNANETANKLIEQLHDRVKEMESKACVDGKRFTISGTLVWEPKFSKLSHMGKGVGVLNMRQLSGEGSQKISDA